MTGRQSVSAALTAVLAIFFVAVGVLPVAAQTQVIQARTPARGGTAGGTTVEVIGNAWFGTFGTTVTMSGGTTQPTNITVHSPSRLTFVTPPRASGACPSNVCVVTITSGVTRTSNFTYVARTRSSVTSARKPTFSYDGRYVAFESRFALAANDTNGLVDIYVRNKLTGAVRRVSVSTTGAQALGGESTSPSISATGRFVAFQSRATNLVAGDTNGLTDIFLHDRDADGDGVFDESGSAGSTSTERVNIGLTVGPVSLPTQAVGGNSIDPVVSGNGRFTAYQSAATNLLGAGDTNGFTDIFVFDRQRRVTRRVSTNFNQVQGDNHSRNPAMSLSGRFIAFESLANNLAGGIPTVGNPPVPASDIFLHDRDTDEDGVMDESGAIDTVLVSTNRCEATLTNHSIEPSITYDGRFVVFATAASNAQVDGNCAPDDRNRARDIFIYDRQFGAVTRRLSQDDRPDLPGASGAPVISGNGNLLLFRTQAVNGGGAGGGAIVAGLSDDGKSTTGQVPSPTTDTPPPADVPPPPPDASTEDPSTSGDGNTTGSTNEPDPGTADGEPVLEVEETPEDADGTPSIGALSPSSGTTAGNNVVQIWGANFQPGAQTEVRWNNNVLAHQFVNSALVRVTPPPAPGGTDGPVTVRVIVNGEASNVVEYNYVGGLVTPSIASFDPANGPVTGGTTVTITGTGFTPGATVRFGAFAGASPIVNGGGTSISVTTPSVPAAGQVELVVQNNNGASVAAAAPFNYAPVGPVSAPSLQPLTPASGPVTGGTAITINGTQFAPGSTTVTIGGVPATDVQVLSNTQIVAVTPAGAQGPADVVVTTAAFGPSPNPQVFQYEPLSAPILSCDLTGNDFDGDGAADSWELQYGFSPADGSDGALDADADGRTNAQECAELTHPRGLYTRYLAEGATGTFFDTRVVLANPGATPARVLFRFQTQLGQVVRHFLMVPAAARRTVDLRLLAGLETADVSTVVESDVQVVVDRTMRWDLSTRAGAHAESSTPAPSLTWYLAEGATHGSFSLFYLIQNPSQTQQAQVRIRYLLPGGVPPIEQMITVAPNTRATIPVDAQPGLLSTDVSGVVESLNAVPVIVERAMYASATGTFAAGHDSVGVTSPSLQWFFAEGATGFFDTFVLLANPNGSAANVTATYLLPSGATISRNHVLPANSRTTLNVQAQSPQLASTAVSVRLASTNGITFIAERAMWWPSGQPWIEAHNAAGATTTGTKWGVADGEVGNLPDDTATFLLIANAAGVAATVRVTLLFETGAAISQDFTVAANARFNVPVLPNEAAPGPGHMRVPRGTRFSAVIESLGATPIVVERAMYWNAAGQFWGAGSDLLATKLQ